MHSTAHKPDARYVADAAPSLPYCDGLGEDVANLRFELDAESSAAAAELVLVLSRMLNS